MSLNNIQKIIEKELSKRDNNLMLFAEIVSDIDISKYDQSEYRVIVAEILENIITNN
jgi:hypothetical protein